MGASRDFTRIKIPHVLLGIYRMQALQLNKGHFDEKNLYYIYILFPSLSDITVYSIIYDSGKYCHLHQP